MGVVKCQLGEMAAGCQLLRESAGLYQWIPRAEIDEQLTVNDVISIAEVGCVERVVKQIHGLKRRITTTLQCSNYRWDGGFPPTPTAFVGPHVIHDVEVSTLSAPRCRPPLLFS